MNGGKTGFTLIEILFAATIAVTILGAAFSVMMQLRNTSAMLELRAAARMDGERALHVISQELGQASLSSISALPAPSVTYRIPVDASGNGTALDAHGRVEWSEERVIQRDMEDANHDGLGAKQLVLVNGDDITVLANGLAPDEKDDNATARPGVWFEPVAGGVRVVIRAQRTVLPGPHVLIEEVERTVHVRNP